MSDEFETQLEDNAPQPSRPEDMEMPQLRQLAVSFGIKAQRDWKREDFLHAINNRRNKQESLVDLVQDDSRAPQPGHARILIHNTQTGSNHPVPVSVNNYQCRIPRDTVVDVPLEILEALNNSKTPLRVKDPKGGVGPDGSPKMVWKDVPSYPFQFIAATPGIARHANGSQKVRPYSPAKHSLKLKYREIYGKWPKRAEFKKFQEMHMERAAEKHMDKEDLEDAKRSKDR